MLSLNQTVPMQLNEIQAKTGKSLEELADIVGWTGLTDHAKIRWMLQREYGLGYDDAKLLVQILFGSTLDEAG